MSKYKILIIFLFGLLCSCTDSNKPDFKDTPIGNFEALWEIIDTKYCFLNSKNIDWDAIGDEYRAQLENMGDEIEQRDLFNLFSSMLDSLYDGHVNLYSDFDVSRSSTWYEGYPVNYNASVVYGDRYLGADYKMAGGFHYNRISEDSIGYVRYSSFSNGFSTNNMYHVFDYFRECKGLIIDVRNNGGGMLTYSEKLSSCFIDEKTLVGYIQHKNGPGHSDFSELEPLYIEPSEYLFWGMPVMLLCNRNSYSATNDFANAMSQLPQVLLVGGKTGGGSGMPLSWELPNGWLLRFSAVPMFNAQKECIEDGINPDVLVNTTLEAALRGEDDIIETAVEIILKVTSQEGNNKQ